MPYKSRAQQKYMHAAAERGEMPMSMIKEFDRETKGKFKKLPEHTKKNDNSYRRGTSLIDMDKMMKDSY